MLLVLKVNDKIMLDHMLATNEQKTYKEQWGCKKMCEENEENRQVIFIAS